MEGIVIRDAAEICESEDVDGTLAVVEPSALEALEVRALEEVEVAALDVLAAAGPFEVVSRCCSGRDTRASAVTTHRASLESNKVLGTVIHSVDSKNHAPLAVRDGAGHLQLRILRVFKITYLVCAQKNHWGATSERVMVNLGSRPKSTSSDRTAKKPESMPCVGVVFFWHGLAKLD
jgi:hypothetical protein